MKDARRDLETWLALPDGWDSFGAKRISADNARFALSLMENLAALDVPRPFITGTTEGGINLQWQSDLFDIQVCYEGPEAYGYWLDKETYEEWEGSLAGNLSNFLPFMERHLLNESESPKQ